MTQHLMFPVRGKRLRATILDDCGNPRAAGTANSAVVTSGFISAKLSAEVEDGVEIVTKKADGSLCINEKFASQFKRLNVEIAFCGVNPALLAMLSNADTYADWSGDIAGITIGEGDINEKFALELWTGLSGVACAANASFAGGYMLLPFVNGGTLGDIEVTGDKAVDFSITKAFTRSGNAWGVGPYNVLLNGSAAPSPLPTALDPLDHFLLMDTALAPPESVTDMVAMPPYISSLSPATGPVAGGTAVVIRGLGFTGATGVTFGGTAGTAFSLISDTEIHVTAPAHTAGAVTVVVTRPTTSATLANAYTYA